VLLSIFVSLEKFEDIKLVIISRKSKKDKPLYIQWSKEKGQTIIHTMVKRNRTDHYTYNGQKKNDRPLYIQWSKEK
jgi:hypothetical protein